MSKKKKSNSRRPFVRSGDPMPPYAPPRPQQARSFSSAPMAIDDVLAYFFPPSNCPECGNDHIHSTVIGHTVHDAEMRPAQRSRLNELRRWGVSDEAQVDACCQCDWIRVTEHGTVGL